MKFVRLENLLLQSVNKYLNIYVIVSMIIFTILLSLMIKPANYDYQTNNLSKENLIASDERLSFGDILNAPVDSLIGNDDGLSIHVKNSGKSNGAMSLILLVLAIGSFVYLCERLSIFNNLFTLITNLPLSLGSISAILISYFTLSAVSYGLYESALCYLPILVAIYKRYNVPRIFALKLLILPLAIGYMASPINPFATIVASEIVGVNPAEQALVRSILLIILLISLIVYLLRELKTYSVEDKPKLSESNSINYYNLILFICPYIIMTIGFIPNFGFNLSLGALTTIFIIFAIVIGLVNKLKLEVIIDYLLCGAKLYMLMALTIGLARMIYVLLYNANIIDPIIVNISLLLVNLNSFSLVIVLFLIFAVFAIFIPSPSALAMVTLPIIAPALALIGFDKSTTVSIYLIAHGALKMISISSPVLIAGLAEIELDYRSYVRSIFPFFIYCIIISLLLITIFTAI